MKPTYGRVSRYGIVAFASSLDQIGPFARDVRDAAALLHAVSGRDERDATSAPEPVPDGPARPARLGRRGGRPRCGASGSRLPREYFVGGHGARRRGARPRGGRSARGGRRRSSTRSRCRTPTTASRPTTSSRRRRRARTSRATTASATAATSRRRRRTSSPTTSLTRGTGFGREVKRRIMLGTYALSAGYYDAYYLKAQKVRTLIKGDFDAVWAAGFDAIVAPTSPSVAWPFGAKLADPVAMYLSDACTLPVNMAGLPGLSVPCGLVGRPACGPPVRRRDHGASSRSCASRAATKRSPRTRTGAPPGHLRSRQPRPREG